LEGSVKVENVNNSVLIKPGQKARISQLNKISVSNLSDPESAIAWKLGYFQFKSTNAQSLMRQISRWYKVDISYQGELMDVSLKGKLPRDASITEVISMLNFVGINCELIGNKLIISNGHSK